MNYPYLWQFGDLLRGMAYRGEWEVVFDFLAEAVKQQTSVRDYLNGEKVIQGFLLVYLNVTHFFLTWSEREMGGGFVDLYLSIINSTLMNRLRTIYPIAIILK